MSSSDNTATWAFFVALLCAAALVFLSGYMTGHGLGYRDGQIDAISGVEIRYELQENPDGTVTWNHKVQP